MRKLLALAFVCIAMQLHAQDKPALIPADTVPAIINHTLDSSQAKFSSELRPLRGVAGAPAPFYTYLWEFGDGTFSFEKDPLHTYLDSGKFDVRLFATNNYDDGKRPPTRPKPVVVKAPKAMLAAAPIPGFFKMGGSVGLKNNCMPKPGDDMMMIMGYRNKPENLKQTISGTIAILYNDREFSSDNFELAETRTYHQETKTELKAEPVLANAMNKQQAVYYASTSYGISKAEIEALLAKEAAAIGAEMQNFKSKQAWHFENLKAGAEQFVFMHFKTTPEMIQDTNATVRLTGVFIPDDPAVERELFSMELQIVASHDPNKMSIRKSRMNYRLTGQNREITYKVRFQNTGKGPAKKVDIGVSLSPVFDPTTIVVSNTKPAVPVGTAAYANQSYMNTVTGKDSVHFIFNNIYLPGTQQDGVNDADSTQGFVEYKIKFKEKPPKLPIFTSADIVFDKNEPIYTNRAAGRFKMGLSPGAIVGIGFPLQSKGSSYITQRNIVLGASIAPYSPFGKYLQAEIYLSDFKEISDTRSVNNIRKDTTIGKQNYIITGRTQTTSTKVTTINIVPVSLRYNFNKYIGAGVGALLAVDISTRLKNNINYTLMGANGTANGNYEALNQDITKTFTDVRATGFADVVVGLVRVGPSVGFRYFYDPKSGTSNASTYVTWKF
ncbi:MAG: PKD domain-containing protein [Bacteroidota bacterium]